MTGRINKFEDLDVWKESFSLSVRLYELLASSKEYGIKDQIIRSSVSIPSNIAEGYESATNKEYMRYLAIAKGSCGELRTQLYILRELGKFDNALIDELIEKTRKISAMLYKLIKTRKENF